MNIPGLFVVMTTVHAPTPAVESFCRLIGDRVIVVGDRKTPVEWEHPSAEYLAPEDQEALGGALARVLPWNHYCRKMLGYLRAVRRGAAVIFDADDDNLPKPDWRIPAFDGVYSHTREDLGFVNVYASFTEKSIWPRGFPLRLIRDPAARVSDAESPGASVRVGVWQILADGDPDVDAIYRLVDGAPCVFRSRPPIVLGAGAACPFNSQATAVRKELFPLLYLPSTVTFRSTDIIRGLVAQPIMWAAGYLLGFTEATVVQDRNPHDNLDDFASELPCYLHAQEMFETAAGAVRSSASVSENLAQAYEALCLRGFVGASEAARAAAWLDDLAAASRRGLD